MKMLALALILGAMPALAATPTDTTVATYHGAPDRAGNYIVPGLNWQSAQLVHRAAGFDGRISGHIYAQPLYWRPDNAGHGFVIAVTESNSVYALDAQTGRVAWRTELGQPVSLASLPCGNIDPVGITGTPVIDAANGTIYFGAMRGQQGKPRHLFYALRLADGSVQPGFPIDVAAGLAGRGIRFDPTVQNQRGALALLNGRVIVPFGGHYGDCGHYHGVLVAIGGEPPQIVSAWETRAAKGGVWAPAGVSEADGSLYFATGNTEGARDWQDGDGVFRLQSDLAHNTATSSVFAPSNWKQLDDNDLDLGGVTPLPLSPPGSYMPLLLALGKDGNAYLLNRTNLGGIGGALAIYKAARGAIITAPTVYTVNNTVLVALEAHAVTCPNGSDVFGIGALAVTVENQPEVHSVWCAPMRGRGAPIVTTTDGSSQPIVWVVGAEGDEQLHGFRGDTGETAYAATKATEPMRGLRHFATILTADARFFIAGDDQIFAYDLLP